MKELYTMAELINLSDKERGDLRQKIIKKIDDEMMDLKTASSEHERMLIDSYIYDLKTVLDDIDSINDWDL